MSSWTDLPDQSVIDATAAALKANGMEAIVVDNGEAAKAKALELIPEGSEVMTMTSVTTDSIGLSSILNESGKYNAVKPKLYALDRNTQGREMKKMGTAPEYSVGSVQAITQDGKILLVSATGSQLPGYAYGSDKVIWIVGAQKIAANLDAALKRTQDYVFPLESERAKKAYGVPGSIMAKTLIVNNEVVPGRITVIIVKEALGY